MQISNGVNKILKISLVLIVVIIVVAGILLLVRLAKDKTKENAGETTAELTFDPQSIKEDAEKITYQTELTFDPQSLQEITDAEAGKKVLSELKAEKTKTTIPPNSKMRLPFETYCLNHDYSAPDAYWPIIPVYRKLDIPLAPEIISYAGSHPDLDQPLLQEVIWDLLEKSKFDGISEEGQALLLKINPQAREIIDSYRYGQNFSVENFVYAEKLPEEVIPQSIPGTGLYAKVSDSSSYDYTEIEVFNPSSTPQVFPLVKDDKILVLMPKEWVEKLNVGFSYFYLVVGKLSISEEETVSTPADAGAIIELEDGRQMAISPNSKYEKAVFEKMIEEKQDSSLWQRLLYSFYPREAKAINWDYVLPPRNKFQMKWPPCPILPPRG